MTTNMEVQETASDDRRGFADLPMEMIINIFRYINFSDIQSASLACRPWCEASQVSEFQSKVLLKFAKTRLSDNSFPGNVFLNTSRSFSNIYLYRTSVETVNNLFSHIGPTVEHIVFEEVSITEEQFKAILEKIPNLKALSVIGAFIMEGQFFKSETGQKFLAASLRNIQEITIQKNRYFTDAVLNFSTSLSPNLKRITIDSVEFLPNIIENHATTLKELHLSEIELSDDYDLLSLTNIKVLDLRKISFMYFHSFQFIAFETFLKTQKNLIELNLSWTNISGSFMELFCDHLIKLEVLELTGCKYISDANIVGVSNLKRLKVFDISACNISSEGVQQGIAKGKNYTLLKLYLRNLNLSEDCLIQCAENFPNLQVLDISFCEVGVTDKVVQAIIKNLTRLRFLSLNVCRLITDAGLTGINVKAQLSSEIATSSFEKLPEMKEVDELTQDGLSIKELKGLQTLQLKGLYKITDASLKNGLKFLELKELNLSNCEHISITGIQALVENCPSIEVLELSNCDNINIECIEVISQHLQRLQFLNINECKQLMDYLEYIVMKCKVLRVLKTVLCGCMKFNIEKFQQSRNILIDRLDYAYIYND